VLAVDRPYLAAVSGVLVAVAKVQGAGVIAADAGRARNSVHVHHTLRAVVAAPAAGLYMSQGSLQIDR
jgi:hypothetical protein